MLQGTNECLGRLIAGRRAEMLRSYHSYHIQIIPLIKELRES